MNFMIRSVRMTPLDRGVLELSAAVIKSLLAKLLIELEYLPCVGMF